MGNGQLDFLEVILVALLIILSLGTAGYAFFYIITGETHGLCLDYNEHTGQVSCKEYSKIGTYGKPEFKLPYDEDKCEKLKTIKICEEVN